MMGDPLRETATSFSLAILLTVLVSWLGSNFGVIIGVLPVKGVWRVFRGVSVTASVTFLLLLELAGVSRLASADLILFLAEALTAVLASAAFRGFLVDLIADLICWTCVSTSKLTLRLSELCDSMKVSQGAFLR